MTILNMNNRHLEEKINEVAPGKLSSEINSISFIAGGSFGKVFEVVLSDKRKVAVKAFRRQGANDEEAMQLKILAENTIVPMPEVLFTYSDDSVSLMGMSFIEGKNVLSPSFLLKGKKKKQRFAEDVVSGMAAWHNVKGEYYGFLDGKKYETWLECYQKEKLEPWLTGLHDLTEKRKFSRRKMKLLTEATLLFYKIYQEPDHPVLIHGDLNIMNIMADEKTFRLTGFIDPCGAMWADEDYDLFQLRNMWGDKYGLYKTYTFFNAPTRYTDFKVAYYAAIHEASCRLQGGLVMPLWEALCNRRLRKEIKKIRDYCI